MLIKNFINQLEIYQKTNILLGKFMIRSLDGNPFLQDPTINRTNTKSKKSDGVSQTIAHKIEKLSQPTTNNVERNKIRPISSEFSDISRRKNFFEEFYTTQRLKRDREKIEDSLIEGKQYPNENAHGLRTSKSLSKTSSSIAKEEENDPSQSQRVLKRSRQDDIPEEKDIEQLFSETFNQDIKEVEVPYDKMLKDIQEYRKEFVTPTQLYRFLLKPEQKQIRDDFLLAGPWMSFFQEDIEKAKALATVNERYKEALQIGNLSNDANSELTAAKAQGPILLKQMENLFNAENCTDTQKKVILEFASKLIQRGIFPKDVFEQGPLSEKNISDMILTLKSSDLIDIATAFINTKANPQQQAENIEYAFLLKSQPSQHKKWPSNPFKQKSKIGPHPINYPSLFDSFSLIAKKERTNEKDFIEQFSQDLAVLSYHNMKTIHPSELYRQTWVKKQDQAPNISHIANAFNQLSAFVVDQIVNTNDLKESQRIYTIFVKIAAQLLTLHDYQDTMSIICGLSNAAVNRLVKSFNLPKDIETSFQKQTELFSFDKNFKNLNQHLELLRHPKSKGQQPIGHVPYLATFLSQLTFADDGNPDHVDQINFSRILMLAQIHRQIETAQNIEGNLSTRQELHYNVIDDIVKMKHQTEDKQYKKSLNLLPRGN